MKIHNTWINLLPHDIQHSEPEQNEFLLRILKIVTTVIIQRRMQKDVESKLLLAMNHVIGSWFIVFYIYIAGVLWFIAFCSTF